MPRGTHAKRLDEEEARRRAPGAGGSGALRPDGRGSRTLASDAALTAGRGPHPACMAPVHIAPARVPPPS